MADFDPNGRLIFHGGRYRTAAGDGVLTPVDPASGDVVGQHNHGVCAVAPDPWSAYEHIERLDHICEIALKSGVAP